MLIKSNSKFLWVILFLVAGAAHADGGLIFLEKNQAAQEQVNPQVDNKGQEENIKQKSE